MRNIKEFAELRAPLWNRNFYDSTNDHIYWLARQVVRSLSEKLLTLDQYYASQRKFGFAFHKFMETQLRKPSIIRAQARWPEMNAACSGMRRWYAN